MQKTKKLIPILLIITVILLSFAPFYIFEGFIGDFGDPIGQTIPNKFLITEYLTKGILPLWNSLSFLGFPFLADIQAGVFYIPDIIIFSISSPLKGHNISILLHLIFTAIGTFLLVKEITKSKITSITISLLLVLTGTFLTKIVYLNFLETISYIPWIMFFLSKKKTYISILSILFSFMIFAGHPIAFFYSLIIILIFFIINASQKWKKFLIGLGSALLITCIQIIPFITLKMESVRDNLSYDQFTEGSLTIKNLSNLLIPFKNEFANSFDTYIHFGTIAFILLIISILLIKKFNNKEKKIYFTGLILCILGLLLSLGGNIPLLAKALYNLPIFNLIRVPSRYIILFHFGAILALSIFLKTLIKQRKIIGLIIAFLLIINSIVIPAIFLERYEIKDGIKQYDGEIKKFIEEKEDIKFSLNTVPKYFLSSSFFLFPNRHVLNYMPNVIGYNPMILKQYHNIFPVAPVGAFEDPNYFLTLYGKFELIGLKYYIFPTMQFLENNNIKDKSYIVDFLEKNGWQKLTPSYSENLDIWKNPNATPFAYFLNKENKIEKMAFKPGKINLEVESNTNDTLIVNQIYLDGWKAFIDKNGDKSIEADKYKNFLQSYKIPKNTKYLKLSYASKSIKYGLFISIIGLLTLFLISFFEIKSYVKNYKKA